MHKIKHIELQKKQLYWNADIWEIEWTYDYDFEGTVPLKRQWQETERALPRKLSFLILEQIQLNKSSPVQKVFCLVPCFLLVAKLEKGFPAQNSNLPLSGIRKALAF